jgi:hypothetical protein
VRQHQSLRTSLNQFIVCAIVAMICSDISRFAYKQAAGLIIS